ncbi:MAG: alpha/beta hydrolase [Candidatus Daviesbacteria bacterium]|nr:alpha/beta hydrolase [Candidatus Daviesbacteria bacterium]
MSKSTIQYHVQGLGEPIILLHGWGGSSKSLENLQIQLSKNFQAITLDLPGFGNSPEPETIYGIKDYAQEIIQITQDLGLKEFHLFGHSFGGQVATQMVLDYPDKVKTLILCDAAVIRRKTISTKVLIKISKFIKSPGLSSFLKIIFRHSDYQKASPKMKQIMNKILQEDLFPCLQQIYTPTLILWGEKDSYTPVWQAKIIHQNIKGSKLKIFSNLRHGLPLSNPEDVAKEIKEFIK